MMPRLDGFGLLRELRADPSTRDVPVILLSARAGEESRVEGLQAGANDYLTKPFSARELLARVGAHLDVARIRREANEAIRLRGAQFQTLLERAPLGVFLVDADFRIREANPIAREAAGDLPGGLVGHDFEDLVRHIWPPHFADQKVQLFRHTLETGEPCVVPELAEYRIDRHVVEYYEWRVDRILLPEGRYGVVCYFRDISQQVLARKAIEESREALRAADRRKDEFLALLAHELRGPLAPLRNMLELMKRREDDRDARHQAHAAMERQLDHLVRLVDDLLDVHRITSDRLELRKQRVELADIVRHAVETCSPQVESSGHQLTVALPPRPVQVHADPARLTQVFGNLLNNACKFTAPGGRIALSAELDEREVVVRVTDTGVGIPSDKLGEIFQMFTQVDRSLERSRGGLGIGLSLVKRLVEMHGGSVTAASDGEGRGSEFAVRLPVLSDAPEAASPRAARETLATRGAHRILVVDDDLESARSLAMVLDAAGHETETAHDGLEAVEVAERFRPRVALLDIGLPKLNGFEVARRIRERPWAERAVLIAVSGWGQDEDRRKSKDAGFDFHFVKPVDFDRLAALLASLPPGREPSPPLARPATGASTSP
jgi:PAS domain S-box-containing protein